MAREIEVQQIKILKVIGQGEFLLISHIEQVCICCKKLHIFVFVLLSKYVATFKIYLRTYFVLYNRDVIIGGFVNLAVVIGIVSYT